LPPQVKIVTDSTSYLLPKTLAEYDIQVVPIKIAFGTEVFSEGVDITNQEFYRRLAASSRPPTTSQPPVGDFVEVYSRLSSLGHPIFSIHLSAKLSGTVNVALAAREKFPQAQIEVVDWLSMGMGLLVTAAARAAAAGESLAQIKAKIGQLAPGVSIFPMLDTLKYAWRGGRIGAGKALFGALLNIKPVLAISSGSVRFKGAVRNREHGVERVIKITRDRVGQRPVHMAVMHAYAPDDAEKLKERVSAEFNCAELWITEFSPVMGYACGTGTLGLAFYPED